MMRRLGSSLLLTAVMTAAALPAAAQSPDVWLEAEFEPTQVYVQAQAVYRLRWYQAVDVRDFKLNGPSARLADLRLLGPDRVYETEHDGRRYRVHERSYAVFPFSSGVLELAGAHALGRVAAVAAKSADGRQPLRIDAPARTLTVHPAPAAADNHPWLPAHSLSLSESWTPATAELRQGQVQRRTIRIEATGVDASQIPPLQIAAAGILVEADQPRLENRLSGELNIGVREQTFKLVALRAGELQLPELQLHWWKLGANALANTTLPARRLHITAAGTPPSAATPPIPPAAAAQPLLPQWLMLLAVAALLTVLITGLGLAYIRYPGMRAARALQRACHQGSAAAVRNALLQWGAVIWPQTPPLTLAALALRLPDPAAHHALASIERSLYGPPSDPAAATALETAVRAVKRGSRKWRRQCIQNSRRRSENFAKVGF
jgi:hypothetical protein